MQYTLEFLLQLLGTFGLDALLFGAVGYLVLRWLGIVQQGAIGTGLLIGPGLGLFTFGPVALAVCTLVGYTAPILIALWLAIVAAGVVACRSKRALAGFEPPILSNGTALRLGIFAWLAALVLHRQLIPLVYQGGLYFGDQIFDMIRAPTIGAFVRDGIVPPVDPYLYPGRDLAFRYYYAWHFSAAHAMLLAGGTSYVCSVALSWLTGYSAMALVAYLAVRISGRASAGYLGILLCLVAGLNEPLARLAGARFAELVALPKIHGPELLAIQMGWAPNHVAAALGVVVLVFLAARAMDVGRPLASGVVIGFVAAFVIGSSAWLGMSIGLCVPIMAVAAALLARREKKNTGSTSNPIRRLGFLALVAGPVALLVALPVLANMGGSKFKSMPIEWWVHPANEWLGNGPAAQIALHWAHTLPIQLGVAFPVGLWALAARRSASREVRLLQSLSLIAVVGMLLQGQFLKSAIINNDFGWRVILTPVLLLNVWAAVALSEWIFVPMTETRYGGWGRVRHRLAAWSAALLVAVGLGTGLAAQHTPHGGWPSEHDLTRRHRHFVFNREREAWERIRQYTGPTDRVQSNPGGIPDTTCWPANTPWHLFAERRTACSGWHRGLTTSILYGEDFDQIMAIVADAFSPWPDPMRMHHLAEAFDVKALLVTATDPGWTTRGLDETGVYQLVHEAPNAYRIYWRTRDLPIRLAEGTPSRRR